MKKSAGSLPDGLPRESDETLNSKKQRVTATKNETFSSEKELTINRSICLEQAGEPATLRATVTGNKEKIRERHQKSASSERGLNSLETEVIELFVRISSLFGQPRSMAEIYGLLFISERPLAMDDFIERLNLSKGSASQGLKYLRNMGAIKPVDLPDARRVHYEAVAELRNLLTGFLRDQIVPQFDEHHSRLEKIAGLVKELPPGDRARINGRVTMLQSWGKRGRRFLPIVVKIMGG